jgi:hypothetical protein
MPLSRHVKNSIFRALEEAGLPVDEFGWSDEGDGVHHHPSGSWLLFNAVIDGRQAVAYRPSRNHPDATVVFGPDMWWFKRLLFSRWITYVRRDIEPDLWEQLKAEFPKYGPFSAEANSPFTTLEQEEIRAQLDLVKQLLHETHPDIRAEELAAIDEKLDYLVGASARMGRIDWRNAVIGALAALVFDRAANPEIVRFLLRSIGAALNHLLGVPPPELLT